MKKNNEKELQTEFDINDDNYEIYRRLYCIKTGMVYDKAEKKEFIVPVLTMVGATLLMGGVVAASVLVGREIDSTGIVAGVGGVVSGMTTFGASIPLTLKIIENYDTKKFKNNYPGINTDVDVLKLEKALERYKELSTVPKDVEYQVEERLEKCSDEVKKLSTSEKIEYYKEQKEFWEKVAIQEKYGLLDMNEIAKVKSKKDDKKIN